MTPSIRNASRRACLVFLALGWALIAVASAPYADFGRLAPFVIEKLPIRFETLWLWSLRVHVASALVALPLCLALATRTLQRNVAWHRPLGRVAGTLVAFALVPSGVVLAFDAKGGVAGALGFLLSAAITGYAVVQGVAAARSHDLVAHRRAMLHVLGQLSVAVTSRTLLVLLDAGGMQPDTAYLVALWVPVVGTAAGVEIGTRSAGLRFRVAAVAAMMAFSWVAATAQASDLTDWVVSRVNHVLVRHLSTRPVSPFSRGRPNPRERRVRALATVESTDADGQTFVPFAVDARFGSVWEEEDILGCAYRGTGAVYVKFGDGYRPAGILLGEPVEEAPRKCVATVAPPPS